MRLELTQTKTEILQQPGTESPDREPGARPAVRQGDRRRVSSRSSPHAALRITPPRTPYLWGSVNRMPVAWRPRSHLLRHAAQLDGALVVGISQSGASTDIVTVLENALARRPHLGITNG